MLHPLLIEEILDVVFRHLFGSSKGTQVTQIDKNSQGAVKATNDIQSCRLVCKMWNERATLIYRNVAPQLEFLIVDDGCLKAVLDNMRKFVGTMKQSSMIPRASYKIDFFPNPHQVNKFKKAQHLLREFFRVCGEAVVKLDLLISADSVLLDTKNLTYFNVPYLNYLKIRFFHRRKNDSGTREAEETPSHPKWLKQLLISAEKLYHFEFEVPSDDHPGREYESELILQMLQVLPGTVKSLNLNLRTLRDSHLQLLTEKVLNLDELALFSGSSINCSHETITKFFGGQSDTLNTLKLQGYSPSLISDGFPQLKELNELVIVGAVKPDPVSFQDIFPKVSIAHLRGMYPSKSNLLWLNASSPMRKLRVDFTFLELPFEVDLVKDLAKCFKNLRVVNLEMKTVRSATEVLRQVFIFLSDIEELVVLLPRNLEPAENVSADSLFSGIADSECKQILRSKNYDNVNLEVVRRYPSLLNMTKLKKLAVVFPIFSSPDIVFTDLAVQLVFLKMDTLEELRISDVNASVDNLAQLIRKLKFSEKTATAWIDITEDKF